MIVSTTPQLPCLQTSEENSGRVGRLVENRCANINPPEQAHVSSYEEACRCW